MAPGGAGSHDWREIDLRIYPTAYGLRWVVFTRVHRGRDRWDRTLDSGSIDLGERPVLADRGAILRAASDALALAADRDGPQPIGPAATPRAAGSVSPGGLQGDGLDPPGVQPPLDGV